MRIIYPRPLSHLSQPLPHAPTLPRPLWESLLVAPNGGLSRGSRARR